MIRRSRVVAVAAAVLGGSLMAGTEQLAAQPIDLPDDVNELIILLAPPARVPNAPRPEEVVEAVNSRPQRPVPHGLGEGNPIAGSLAIPQRPTGRTAQWIADNFDRPYARLYRYLILRYREQVNLEAIFLALQNNPVVESVEPNLELTLSTTIPADPRFGTGNETDPLFFQWGFYAMNFPEAWDMTSGHSYVGIIDTGIQTSHPDMVAFQGEGASTVFVGGPFREHLSIDYNASGGAEFDCNVDEVHPVHPNLAGPAGHGTHVGGLIAGHANNMLGTASACWHCSLLVTRAFSQSGQAAFDDAGESMIFLMARGAQVMNLSAGIQDLIPPIQIQTCDGTSLIDPQFLCDAMIATNERDVLIVAASGNHRQDRIQFPASEDDKVLAVGGVEFDPVTRSFAFWDDYPSCPAVLFPSEGYLSDEECGSNFGAGQDLVAPAKTVLSSVYTAKDHNPLLACGDGVFFPEEIPPDPGGSTDGFGPCSGTSMSTPHIAGLSGLVRSINPLLTNAEVRDVLTSTASHATSRTDELGYGVPDAAAAVRTTLGMAGGQVLPNRLTPLLSFYSPVSGLPGDEKDATHAYTTFPQAASAFIFYNYKPFDTVGAPVPGYGLFPGTECQATPCTTDQQPGASVYVFTTGAPPFLGTPPLVPLYRLQFDPNLPHRCDDDPPPRIKNRDFSYATTEEEVVYFKQNGYELDGIEGYIFERCSPEPSCIPEGAVPLYRLRNTDLNDYAIFPGSELLQMQGEGYTEAPDGLETVLGYVYLNHDTDGDHLIDAFENLIGTDPAVPDTDGDGVSDGEEVLEYDLTWHGYGDPLDRLLFRDGFETGDTSRWSASNP